MHAMCMENDCGAFAWKCRGWGGGEVCSLEIFYTDNLVVVAVVVVVVLLVVVVVVVVVFVHVVTHGRMLVFLCRM